MTSVLKKRTALITAILALSIATGCGNNNNNTAANDTGNEAATTNATNNAAANEAATDTAANTTEEAAPAAVTIDEAKAAELQAKFGDKKPEKVVVASVAIAELLDALGVMPVGVPTSMSALPAAFDNVQKIGSALKPDAEVITSLEPDVVLGPASIQDSLDKQLGSAKLNMVYIPTDSLEELTLSTVVLGHVFGQEQKATDLVNGLATAEAAAVKQAEGQTQPKVMFLFGSAESFMLMNESTYAGSMAKKLGASNVVSDVLKSQETYVPLDMESVVTANPDVILLVAHGDPEAAKKAFEDDVKKNGAWEKLNAFKNNRVEALDYNLFGITSITKAASAYQELASKLYPAN
ncbi:helical backbone metal receptor [Paenibacillus sp. BC26]|uniref:helical backbone metal receptor n=1 Tax=Paenibacillus sp. BC26 TaxID=1881032 RepID=UPI0008ECC3C4|nr:helical backbone metal receptor [Paenibacillus sp. BC26]SFT26645.1 iron complex transport system substrate-binding protein [Paenibacillus sp. BC26]